MHYRAIVLIPGETPPDDIETAVAQRMDRYDENKSVPRWRNYLSPESLTRMAKYYNLDITDTPALVAKVKDWDGVDGDVDTKGIFGWSTFNPVSIWDYYLIGGRSSGFFNGQNTTPVQTLTPDDVWPSSAIVEPNGDLHTREAWIHERFDVKPDDVWRDEISKLFAFHHNCLAVVVDYHR